MIVWNGWGIVTALIGILGMVFSVVIPNKLTGSDDYLKQHTWIWMIGMGLAALVNYGFYKLLSRQKARIVIDKQTGQEIHLQKSHSLFFIPVKWWSFIFLALGLLWIFIGDK